MTDGGLPTAGGADQREGFARCNGEVDVVQDGNTALIGKGHVVEADLSSDIRENTGIRGVLNLRFCPHQLDKAVEAGTALSIDFHELDQLADRGDKGGDIEREGQKVDKVKLPAHDQQAAGSDHRHLHDADRGFDSGVEKAHGTIIPDLAGFEGFVGEVEFGILRLLSGEGLRGADAGDAALNGGVDLSRPDLDVLVGLLHPEPLTDREGDTEGQQNDEYQSQLDVDGQKNDQGTEKRHTAGQDIFRTVMRELHNLEQVAGNTGHQDTGPVAVKEREGQRLHVYKHIAPHIRLHQRSHAVTDNGDQILEPGPQQVGGKKKRHHGEERGKLLLGQQRVHGVPGHIGEGQIYQRHRQRQTHIQRKCAAMRSNVGGKDRKL